MCSTANDFSFYIYYLLFIFSIITGNPNTLSEMKLNVLLFIYVLVSFKSFRRDLNDAKAVYISEHFLACRFVIITLRLPLKFGVTNSHRGSDSQISQRPMTDYKAAREIKVGNVNRLRVMQIPSKTTRKTQEQG